MCSPYWKSVIMTDCLVERMPYICVLCTQPQGRVQREDRNSNISDNINVRSLANEYLSARVVWLRRPGRREQLTAEVSEAATRSPQP